MDKKIEELANELYNLQDRYDMSNPFEIAKAVLSLGYIKIDYNNLDIISSMTFNGKEFVAIPKGSMFISNEEYERFQKMENTLKRISTVSPTEAESENKALKETIGIVLAQKRNIWKRYNEKCKEYALAEEKTRKEVLEKINERLCTFKLENKSQEFTDGYTEAIDEVCGRLDEIAKELDIKG